MTTSSLQSESIRSVSSASDGGQERSLLRHYRNRAKNFFICCKADQSKKLKKTAFKMENETRRSAKASRIPETNKEDEVEALVEEKKKFESIITTSSIGMGRDIGSPSGSSGQSSPVTSLHHPTVPVKINTTRSSPTVQQVRSLQMSRHNSEVLRKQHRMQIKQIAFLLALSMLTTMYVICRDKTEQCYYVQLIGLVVVCFITSLTYFLLRHRKFKPLSSVALAHINMTSAGSSSSSTAAVP